MSTKPCARHSSEITGALRKKGMWQLVSHDSEETRVRTTKWLQGRAGPNDIDPLIITLLEINQKAQQLCGEYLFSRTFTYCPLCEVEKTLKRADAGAEWIDNSTDAVLLLCMTNHVVTAAH